MIKKLLIGASALALTTTVAHAQSINFDQLGSQAASAPTVAPVTITTQVQVGARFDDLQVGRPNYATNVNPSTDNRHGSYNTTPLPRETPASVFAGINSSVPTGRKATDAANKGTIDQNGNGNTATIFQEKGEQGFAVVQQDNAGNTAVVVQQDAVGSDGTLSGGASNNLAYIQQQTGSPNANNGNQARIRQYYDETVTGVLAPSKGALTEVSNKAVILQGENVNGHYSLAGAATLEQVGTGNDGIIRQGSNGPTGNSVAYLQQEGYSNFSAIRQGSENGGSNLRDGRVFQSGELHTANIVQLGFGSTDADIVQDGGTRNQANIVQRGSTVEASILQTGGDFNATYLEQGLNSGGSKAAVEQKGGNQNYAEVYQNVANANAKVLQDGSLNVGVVSQTAVGFSAATIDSNGSNNFATIRQ